MSAIHPIAVLREGGIDQRLDGPLGLGGFKSLPLRVVADDVDIDEATEVELLRPEHRHPDGWLCVCVCPADVVGKGVRLSVVTSIFNEVQIDVANLPAL